MTKIEELEAKKKDLYAQARAINEKYKPLLDERKHLKFLLSNAYRQPLEMDKSDISAKLLSINTSLEEYFAQIGLIADEVDNLDFLISIEKGKEYIYPERHDAWEQTINQLTERKNSDTLPSLLSTPLSMVKFVNEVMELSSSSPKEATKIIAYYFTQRRLESIGSIKDVEKIDPKEQSECEKILTYMIITFCKTGPELIEKAVHPKALTRKQKNYIEKVQKAI